MVMQILLGILNLVVLAAAATDRLPSAPRQAPIMLAWVALNVAAAVDSHRLLRRLTGLR